MFCGSQLCLISKCPGDIVSKTVSSSWRPKTVWCLDVSSRQCDSCHRHFLSEREKYGEVVRPDTHPALAEGCQIRLSKNLHFADRDKGSHMPFAARRVRSRLFLVSDCRREAQPDRVSSCGLRGRENNANHPVRRAVLTAGGTGSF